jgi:hypothetical protein
MKADVQQVMSHHFRIRSQVIWRKEQMKLKTTVVLIILVLSALSVAGVSANGQNPAQLTRAGWDCFNAGPHNWVHCTPPGAAASPATMSVKVFDTEDVGAIVADFFGTELLIHRDIYSGQPCPQNDLESYEDLSDIGLPYFACHHFDTEHH